MKTEEIPRLVMSAALILYFGYALIVHWSEGIEETLKAAFMIAVGYWLGSSKGSSDKQKALDSLPDGTPGDPVSVEQVR